MAETCNQGQHHLETAGKLWLTKVMNPYLCTNTHKTEDGIVAPIPCLAGATQVPLAAGATATLETLSLESQKAERLEQKGICCACSTSS